MKILNLGSGPVTIGNFPGIEITHADIQDRGEFVDREDMEKLTYPDDSFDLVICINALDHTINAPAALKEMLRVSKHWVHIDCALDQLDLQGKKHYWNAKPDGRFESDHPRTSGYDGATPLDDFDLKDFGFEVECVNDHMIARKHG